MMMLLLNRFGCLMQPSGCSMKSLSICTASALTTSMWLLTTISSRKNWWTSLRQVRHWSEYCIKSRWSPSAMMPPTWEGGRRLYRLDFLSMSCLIRRGDEMTMDVPEPNLSE